MRAQHIMEKRDKFGLVGWESSKRRSVKLRLMSSKMTGSGTKLKRSLSLLLAQKIPGNFWAEVGPK